jgi:signal transduction histidine kinase
MRTPLNAIMGFGSFLEDGCAGPLNDRQRDFVQKIMKGSDRMLLLVDDLLDFARMQAGTFFICLEEIDFSCLVKEAIASFEPTAAEKRIKIEADIDLPHFVRLDRHRIFQVLENLLANALKFTPEGGRIRVKAFLRDADLIVEVQDNGIGMEEEDVQKIFAPFRQLDMGLTRKAGGVGLGLSISRAIVEAHGGTLVAESPGPGMGSTFRFVIPASGASS